MAVFDSYTFSFGLMPLNIHKVSLLSFLCISLKDVYYIHLATLSFLPSSSVTTKDFYSFYKFTLCIVANEDHHKK